MNGYIVDNVACGGCHTLLTATKGSNSDFTNNDFSVVTEPTSLTTLTELPPLQKVPGAVMNKALENISTNTEDVTNSNTADPLNSDIINGNLNNDEENASIDSLEANVSGSHIVNINDLDGDNISGIIDLNKDDDKKDTTDSRPVSSVISESISNVKTNATDIFNEFKNEVQTTVNAETDELKKEIEVIEETIAKKMDFIDPGHKCEEIKSLGIPDKLSEVKNSPPPKSPVLQELLHIPDVVDVSPNMSRQSDDGQKSECGSKSENETLPCGSDKSSPQVGKTAKTQAVLPIIRNEDIINTPDENLQNEDTDTDVVTEKLPEKGRFAKMFQSIRDKENSCIGKGKVIEDTVTGKL